MQVNPQHHELPPVLQTKLVSDNQQTDKHPKDYDLHEKCEKFNTVRMFDHQLMLTLDVHHLDYIKIPSNLAALIDHTLPSCTRSALLPMNIISEQMIALHMHKQWP